MMTPVQYLFNYMFEKELLRNEEGIKKVVDTMLQVEEQCAQKYAEFCVECDRKGLPLITFKDWMKL